MTRDEIDILGDEIAVAAACIDAASRKLLVMIRDFDAAHGWARQGAKSCAHWLSWRIGLGLAAARDHVRVAHALGGLPQVEAALGRGELSYAKVRAMTRVATPETEGRLLEMARSSTGAQLERICRGFRQVQALGREPRVLEERDVRVRRTDGPLVRLEADLLPDEAELVMAALRRAREQLRAEQKDASAEPSMADALVLVAESFAGATTSATRAELTVVLREEQVADTATWRAELADGTAVPGATLQRLACDAGIVVATTSTHGAPIDVGRKRRTIPPALARALRLRDGSCRFPGCTHRAFIEAHHIEHWADGGTTSLENLTLLCRFHHVAVHEGGFEVAREASELVFRTPSGTPIPACAPPTPADARPLVPPGTVIDRTTSLPHWDGTPLDLHASVSALVHAQLRP